MSYHYILHPLAQQEYEKAVEWYATRSNKAGENLIIEIEQAL